MFRAGAYVFWAIIPVYILKYIVFRVGEDKLLGQITKLAIGLLAAYFMKELIFFGLARVIGLGNIPPP